MHITTLEEYGIRCALQLARFSADNESQAIRASQIADVEGLSTDYVAKIMQIFRKTGLVTSVRGHQGGFILSRDSKDVSLKDVMDCLQAKGKTSNDEEFCDLYKGLNEECAHNCDCPLRPVWTIHFTYFDEVLGAVSLKDLLVKEEESKKYIRSLALKKCKEVVGRLKVN